MSDFAIEAEGLGKRYLLGENTSRDRLRDALQAIAPRWLKSDAVDFWALRDASFSIAQGEAIGVIGRNGAGKSTLLKLLSRVTKPTEGWARVRGRLGTLLEVGTGFHPELTGRDNIFLSGAILGMAHAEVRRKFDAIVDFSEVAQFVDTPVKRYSSGMYVRLAFAVAAFLDPDILIVDEVLAVGDAAFQRKSLGHLNQTSAQQGRTVLFVSHNLSAIRNFCRRVLLLEHGKLVFDGPTQEGIERYLRTIPRALDVRNVKLTDRLNRTSGAIRFTYVTCTGEAGGKHWQVKCGGDVRFRFDFEAYEAIPDVVFGLQLRSATGGELVTTIREIISNSPIQAGRTGTIELTLTNVALRPGELSIYAWLGRSDGRFSYDVIEQNVDMPFLKIVSDGGDSREGDGIISLPYRLRTVDLVAK
jgi:lipopolysaccharide transport system ATP-binding protein